MATSDFLFDVGFDTRQASKDVQAFVNETTKRLGSLKNVVVSIDQNKANSQVDNFVSRSNTRLASIKTINLKVNTAGAGQAISGISNQAGNAANSINNLTNATTRAASASRLHIGAMGQQTAAMDLLSRIAGNTVFKFIEYEVIMKAFNAVIHEFVFSIQEASNVQFEQTLQRLYNPLLDVNKALENSITIAKKWGSDITDVQQVIGLWTKNVSSLSAATYLADQAEQLHRASGIETQEVYRKSVAILTQFGLAAKALPGIYDQVAEAALRMALPMKAMGKGGQEGMKELFEGLAESAATLKAMGFDTAGALAVVSNQITATSDAGKGAAKNLSSMFAALEGKGTNRKNFEAIMGPIAEGADKTDRLLQRMIDKAPKIFQAYSNGDFGVRPQQFETLQTFLGSLQNIQKIRRDLLNNSNMKLQLISEAEIATFQGQTDRLKASVQAMSLSFGRQILPGATEFVRVLSGSVLPALGAMAPAIALATGVLLKMGAAFLIVQGGLKVTNALQAFNTATATTTATTNLFTASGYNLTRSLGVMESAMVREQAVIDALEAKMKILNWETSTTSAKLKDSAVTVDMFNAAMTRANFSSFLTGLKSIGLTAIRQAGPLIGLIGLMKMAEGMDARNAAAAGLRYEDQGKLRGRDKLKGVLGTAWNEGLPMAGAWATGNYAHVTDMTRLREQMLHDKTAKPGSLTWYLKQSEYTARQAEAKGHPELAIKFRAEGRKYVEEQYDKHHDETAKSARDQFMRDSAVQAPLAHGATEAPPYNKEGKAKKEKGMQTPEGAYRQEIDKVKREDQAAVAGYEAQVSADKTRIASLMKDANASNRVEPADIAAITAVYADEKKALTSVIEAKRKEESDLASQIVKGEAYLATHKKMTSARAQEANALSMAVTAYTKTGDSIQEVQARLEALGATEDREMGKLKSTAAIQNLGSLLLGSKNSGKQESLSNFWGTLKIPQDERTNSIARYTSDLNKLVSASASAKTAIGSLDASIYAGNQIDQMGKTVHAWFNENQDTLTVADKTAALAFLAALDAAMRNNINTTSERTQKLKDMDTAARDMTEKIGSKNTASLEDLLHIDKSSTTYLDGMLQGYKDIADEYEKISKMEKEYGYDATGTHAAILTALKAQVAEQAKLLPILEREKALRATIEYQATQSVIEKHGSAHINSSIDKIFGGKDEFSQMLNEWTKQVMDSWWKTTAQKLTDSLFGNSTKEKEDALKAMYKAHVDGMTAAAQQMEQAALNMQTAANTMPGAGVPGLPELTDGVLGTSSTSTLTSSSPLAALAQLMVLPASATATSTAALVAPTQQIADNTAQIAANSAQTGGGEAGAPSFGNLSSMLPFLLSGSSGGAGSKLGALAMLMTMGAGMLGRFDGGGGGKPTLNPDGTLSTGGSLAGSNLGSLLGKTGKGLGAAASVYGGIQQGGISGGIQSALGMDQLALLLGASGGVATPLAVAAGLFALLSHHDDPAKMPDKYMPGYGQFVSNLNGTVGMFNGQSVGPSSQYDTTLGNKSEQAQLWDWLSNPGNIGQLSGSSLDAVNRLKALGGSNGDLGIKGEKDGVFTLGSGMTVKVDDYKTLIDQVTAIKDNTAKMALAPIFSVNAYNMTPGSSPFGVYNTPGLGSASFKQMQAAWGTTGTSTTPSPLTGNGFVNGMPVTPGSNGIVAPLPPGPQYVMAIVNLDGQVLATAVNAVNSDKVDRRLVVA